MIGQGACDAAVSGVPFAANILLLLASHNNPAASAVAVADVIPAVGFQRVPAVVIVSAVAGVPAAVVVLTVVDVSGVPAVAKISVVAAVTTAVDVFPV
jgi:hypothetical protein